MDVKTRAFLAVGIPDEISARISELQEFLKKSNADANWVPPENFHYNIKFFGYLSEPELKKVIDATRKVVSASKSFEIEICGIGGFPTLTSPRVLWLGVKKGADEMKVLADSLDKEYFSLGIPAEEREFKPHLTLCRLKSGHSKDALVRAAKQKQHIDIGSFKVTELVLFKSTLKPAGPVYEPIEKFMLG